MQETIDIPIQVSRVVPFEPMEGSKGLAAVLLTVGPLSVWCRIFLDPKGQPFLSMPSRKGKEDRYYQAAYFSDRRFHEQAERLAVEAYRKSDVSNN